VNVRSKSVANQAKVRQTHEVASSVCSARHFLFVALRAQDTLQ
jgi:hypothetical protein